LDYINFADIFLTPKITGRIRDALNDNFPRSLDVISSAHVTSSSFRPANSMVSPCAQRLGSVEVAMTQFKSHLWVTVAVLLLAFTAWIGNEASRAVPVPAQQPDKVLEIERYPDEPLQLVNFRIGTQSVKDRIKMKFQDPKSKLGIDRVEFKEKDDWFKRVSVTLRNTSTRPVYGVTAVLYFKPAGYSIIFSLPLTASRRLRNDPCLPEAEIELTVNPGYLDQTLEVLKSQGVDASRTDVTFSLDTVIFSDELHWNKGNLIQPDPTTPDKWIPVDDRVAMKRNKPLVNTPFVPASFKTAAPVKPAAPVKSAAPVVLATCTIWHGSVIGPSCSGDPADCITKNEIDDSPDPGVRSQQLVFGLCEDQRNLGLTCSTFTTHTKMVIDPNCVPCPDADGDGYYDSACGGTDCRDDKAAVHPGASESTYLKCLDAYDNDCDGATNCEDSDCWNTAACPCEPVSCGEGTVPGSYPDCGCVPYSPVVVDVAGNGFNLTSASTGVSFDFNGDGTADRISWTASNSDDAWLSLDRDGNGTIDNGRELFGNLTPQSSPPPGMGRNGFNALVEYDKPAKGGNADGLITERDAIFRDLLLWQDTNHNGVSEASELHTLNQLGLTAIECDYKESKRKDQFGNQFRYRAKVRDLRDTQINRWAWDVFLLSDTSNPVVANVLGLVNPTKENIGNLLRD